MPDIPPSYHTVSPHAMPPSTIWWGTARWRCVRACAVCGGGRCVCVWGSARVVRCAWWAWQQAGSVVCGAVGGRWVSASRHVYFMILRRCSPARRRVIFRERIGSAPCARVGVSRAPPYHAHARAASDSARRAAPSRRRRRLCCASVSRASRSSATCRHQR